LSGHCGSCGRPSASLAAALALGGQRRRQASGLRSYFFSGRIEELESRL
jgi:hypothetical protein